MTTFGMWVDSLPDWAFCLVTILTLIVMMAAMSHAYGIAPWQGDE